MIVSVPHQTPSYLVIEVNRARPWVCISSAMQIVHMVVQKRLCETEKVSFVHCVTKSQALFELLKPESPSFFRGHLKGNT